MAKYREYYRQSDISVFERMTEIAGRRGVSNAEIAVAWILNQPEITASIVGPTKIEHLDEAVQASELKLDGDELKMLADPYEPHGVSGHS